MFSRALALALLLLAHPAHALTQDDVLSARLLPGWQMASGTRMAGLELRLAPGWKTYWRAPGEAGIPPSFDFSGSDNLQAVRIHWPRPAVFELNGLQTIGYHDGVVLPIEITPRDPARPITLRATVDLGVCKDICLPASLSLAADLAGAGAADSSIDRALADRPTSAAGAGLTGIGCRLEAISDGLRITARIGLPAQGPVETVVFETATADVWVSTATSTRQGADLVAQADLVPSSGAPFALDRSGVTVTVLSENRAVEITGCPAP